MEAIALPTLTTDKASSRPSKRQQGLGQDAGAWSWTKAPSSKDLHPQSRLLVDLLCIMTKETVGFKYQFKIQFITMGSPGDKHLKLLVTWHPESLVVPSCL